MTRITESAERRISIEGEQRRERSRSARLVSVFLLGCAGFLGPLFWATSRADGPGGWPAPFVFVYLFWAALIGLVALALGRARD